MYFMDNTLYTKIKMRGTSESWIKNEMCLGLYPIPSKEKISIAHSERMSVCLFRINERLPTLKKNERWKKPNVFDRLFRMNNRLFIQNERVLFCILLNSLHSVSFVSYTLYNLILQFLSAFICVQFTFNSFRVHNIRL